jgi:hypothetical protein
MRGTKFMMRFTSNTNNDYHLIDILPPKEGTIDHQLEIILKTLDRPLNMFLNHFYFYKESPCHLINPILIMGSIVTTIICFKNLACYDEEKYSANPDSYLAGGISGIVGTGLFSSFYYCCHPTMTSIFDSKLRYVLNTEQLTLLSKYYSYGFEHTSAARIITMIKNIQGARACRNFFPLVIWKMIKDYLVPLTNTININFKQLQESTALKLRNIKLFNPETIVKKAMRDEQEAQLIEEEITLFSKISEPIESTYSLILSLIERAHFLDAKSTLYCAATKEHVENISNKLYNTAPVFGDTQTKSTLIKRKKISEEFSTAIHASEITLSIKNKIHLFSTKIAPAVLGTHTNLRREINESAATYKNEDAIEFIKYASR